MRLRRLAAWLIPLGLIGLARRLLGRPWRDTSRDFVYVGTAWPAAETSEPAWDDMAATLAERWPAFVDACSGTAPLDVAHEAAEHTARNDAFHNTYMTFGYVLTLAARSRPRLSVMDWGGGLGHYRVIAESLLPDVDFDYHVKDLPAVCEQGRRLSPEITFHDSDACLEERYDLVMASGSLHCVADWRSAATCLARATRGHLYITRLPVLLAAPTCVMRQDATQHGFSDELLEWFINRDEFLDHMDEQGMELVREFYVQEAHDVGDDALRPDTRGFLFRPARYA